MPGRAEGLSRRRHFFAGTVLSCLLATGVAGAGWASGRTTLEDGGWCGEVPSAPVVRWRIVRGRGADFRRLWNAWDAETRLLVQRVNRKDYRHLQRSRFVVVPQGETPRGPVAGPFPPCLASAASVGKIVFVDQSNQAFGAYEAGRLARWGAVSTGTERHPTPNGLYHANWRSRLKRSTINANWLMPWYVNLHTSMGVAFHQYELPGHPASYGCIRLLREDARWLYEWLELGRPDPETPGAWLQWGTPVIVLGTPPREAPYPWERLTEDAGADRVDSADLTAALESYRWAIERRVGRSKR
ncbi:MAG: hypothetical protein Kow00109_06450 [Acidobacteriota bacterium]